MQFGWHDMTHTTPLWCNRYCYGYQGAWYMWLERYKHAIDRWLAPACDRYKSKYFGWVEVYLLYTRRPRWKATFKKIATNVFKKVSLLAPAVSKNKTVSFPHEKSTTWLCVQNWEIWSRDWLHFLSKIGPWVAPANRLDQGDGYSIISAHQRVTKCYCSEKFYSIRYAMQCRMNIGKCTRKIQ